MALALGSASRAKADRYLEEQAGLVAKQSHHLDEQLKQVKLTTLNQRLNIALKLATGLVGLGVIAGLGLAMWNATQARGLSVPVGRHGPLRTGVQIIPARMREDMALDAGEVIEAAQGGAKPVDPAW